MPAFTKIPLPVLLLKLVFTPVLANEGVMAPVPEVKDSPAAFGDCEHLQQQLEATTRDLVDLKIENEKIRQELRAWQRKTGERNGEP